MSCEITKSVKNGKMIKTKSLVPNLKETNPMKIMDSLKPNDSDRIKKSSDCDKSLDPTQFMIVSKILSSRSTDEYQAKSMRRKNYRQANLVEPLNFRSLMEKKPDENATV